jgi:protein O-mannosyl-transferase
MKSRWPYFVLIGCSLHIYFRTLFFEFSYLDDQTIILENNWLIKNPAFIGQIFVRDAYNDYHLVDGNPFYRPILILSFMFDAQFGGTHPFMYHLTNVLCHMVASCLVFSFLLTLGVRRHAAFVLSLFFTVHPLLTQAVAWIPGRNDSLLAIFALSAMITLVRYRQKGQLRYLLAHGCLFAGGLFTKETMVFFPLIGGIWMAMDAVSSRHHKDAEAKNHLSVKGWFLFGAIPAAWILPATVWYAMRNTMISRLLDPPPHYSLSDMLYSVVHNTPSLLIDIGKIFLPVNLSVLPILPDTTLIYGITVLAVAIALAAISIVRFQVRCRQSLHNGNAFSLPTLQPFFFGVAWFLLFLIPTLLWSGRVSTGVVLEHRMYVPLVGLLLAMAQSGFIRKIDLYKKSTWFLAAIYIYAMSLATMQYEEVFRDKIAFHQNAVSHSPHYSSAHLGRGYALYLDGENELAEKEILTCLALNPRETAAHTYLGVIYKSRGEYLRAQDEYKKELALHPNFYLPFFYWGDLCYAAGNKKDAETLWLRTLEVYPDYIDAMRKLYSYYQETGDMVQALRISAEMKKRGVTP